MFMLQARLTLLLVVLFSGSALLNATAMAANAQHL
jgi:hypothetical protein